MSAKKWVFKDPSDIANYGFSWAPLIKDPDDEIVSTTCVVTDGDVEIVFHQRYLAMAQTTVTRLSGGTIGNNVLTMHIVCESGQEFDQDIKLPVKQRV